MKGGEEAPGENLGLCSLLVSPAFLPVLRKELVEPSLRGSRDPVEAIGEPGLRTTSLPALCSRRTTRRRSAVSPLIPCSMSNSASIRVTAFSQWRDRQRVLAALLAGGDVGKLVELSPGVTPTERLGDRRRGPVRFIEPVVSGIATDILIP